MRAALRQTFVALRNPNYRLWFVGQLISMVGTWMQSTAQGYLVYSLTGSAALLGVIGFAGGLPSWLFSLYGGVIADRVSRRRLLLTTQTIMMLLSLALGALVFAGVVQPWHIVVMAFLLGSANAFDAPARQAFVVDLIEDRADMTNAIALNAMLFNAATMIGPAAAGFIYAGFGPGWCFAINGLSFIAVLVALARMQVSDAAAAPRAGSALSQIRDSLAYIRTERSIVLLMTALCVINVLGFGFLVQMPLWARDVLGGDVTTNGFLLSARGVGAVLGALVLAGFGARRAEGKLWTIGTFLLPAFLIAFSFSRVVPVSLLLMVGVGGSLMFVFNTTNALVQKQIPDDQRGRVMAVYTMIFLGSMPIGSLLVGTLTELLSAPIAVLLCALILLGFTLTSWYLHPQIRRMR